MVSLPTSEFVRLRKGFTLIEMLAVIAVLGIIAAILIPTIGSVRQTAYQSSCASNLRQIYTALSLFTTENNNQIPAWTTRFRIIGDPDHAEGREMQWHWLLLPYLSGVSRTTSVQEDISASQIYNKLRSPGVPTNYGFPIPKEGAANIFEAYVPVQYSVNLSLDQSNTAGVAGNGLSRATSLLDIEDPAKLIYLTIGHGPFTTASGQRVGFVLPPEGGLNAPPIAERIFFPYRGTTNALFLDGHIEQLTPPIDITLMNSWIH